mmetsp:Transcript_9549/g.17923  ORF Transcript_9549/g.17923 Transcript_9549/m.17923 type:complete len:255 (-) Transcript_9549:604-1368(-)
MQVKVVGGLVKKQEVRLDEQGPRQGDAHSPPSGKRLGVALLHLLVEGETVQDLGRFGWRAVSINLIQSLVDFLQQGLLVTPLPLLITRVAGGRRALLQYLGFLLEQLPSLDVAVQDTLEDGLVLPRDFLCHVEDLAVVWYSSNVLSTRAQVPEQRGLPRPVATDESVPPSPRQSEVGVVHELLPCNIHGNALEVEVHYRVPTLVSHDGWDVPALRFLHHLPERLPVLLQLLLRQFLLPLLPSLQLGLLLVGYVR